MSKVIVLVIAVLGAAAILILGYGTDGDANAFSARTERAVVADNSNPENRKQKITAVDSNPTPDALERKDRSIARLRSEGVPVIEHLPAIEAESQVVRRAALTMSPTELWSSWSWHSKQRDSNSRLLSTT